MPCLIGWVHLGIPRGPAPQNLFADRLLVPHCSLGGTASDMVATTLRAEALSCFVPILVLRQLAESGTADLAPRRDSFPAAVLFADISGFTKLSERLGKRGPKGVEELTQTLNDYFGDLIDAVISSGGDIVKFAGDALLAVWPKDEHSPAETVQAAARCAILAQQILKDRQTKDGESLSLRIGIGTGVVTTASVGGERNRWEFLVSGPPVLKATKAADAANRGDVVMSASAAKTIASLIKGVPLAEGQVRLDAIDGTSPSMPQVLPAILPAFEKQILHYVPAAIHRRLDVGHGNWLGELRRLTVLFVNLPNLSHATPLALSQQVMHTLQTSLYRYEGSVNKISVDDKGLTLVAAFGLPPLAHEDDELRGVLAAIDIQTGLKGLGQKSSIGITSGRVFCGIIGNKSRCEYTMIGDVVNLSARLMQKAQGGVLCDQATSLGANRRMAFEPLPAVSLKGKAEPVPIYRPLGKRRAGEGHRPLSPMIGREKEQRLLEELQQSLADRATGAIAIVDGEPGIGKSRLVSALREGAKAKSITTYIGAALDIERSTPYFAWRGVFRDLLEMDGSDGETRQSLEVANHFANWLEKCGKPGELAPLLNPVLATELPDNALTAQLTHEARVNMTNDLLLKLLQIEARLHPIQVVLEDCHWMDSASWTLARLLAENAEDFLLVIITRPLSDKPPAEYTQILQQKNVTRISLSPLSEQDVETLVCRQLGVSELPPQVGQLIQTKAQGNPLFGEELAFALRDADVIRIQEGRCVLSSEKDLAELGFPDTVQGVVTSRIDRLVPSEQLTLKVASVIGRAFSCQILKDMFPVEEDRPLQTAQLESLSRRDLITAQDVEEELDYQFRHVITQEVAYDLIPPTQRQGLHQAIAQWYESEHGEDLSPFFALLAKHWSRTEKTDKAIYYLEKSGESAARQFANSEVIQFFTEAIKRNESASQKVPPERSAHWHRQVAEACYNLGDLVSSLDHFRSALSQLRLPFPQGRLGTMASTLLELGKQFGLKALAKLICRRTAKSRSQLLEAAQCYERLAQIHYLNNSRLQTIHAVFKALNLAEAVGPSAVLARCYANAAVVAGLLLMHGQARYYAKRANEVAAEIDEPDCTSYVGLILGIYWVTVGEWDVADKLLESAVAIAERIRARRRWAESAFTLVIGNWRRGAITRCRELANAGHQAGLRDRVPQVQLWGISWSLRCVLAQSDEADLVRRLTAELHDCLKHNEATAADRILGHGMLAAGRWRLGEQDAALEEAFRVTRLIAETNQISHYLMPAYAALFEVYSGSLVNATDPAKRKRIAKALNAVRRSMWEFGVMYPIGRVQYGLHEGQYHIQCGHVRRAKRAWKRALELAKKYQMPFLEAQLHAELARNQRDTGDQREFHRQKARELFQATETWHHLNRLEQAQLMNSQ